MENEIQNFDYSTEAPNTPDWIKPLQNDARKKLATLADSFGLNAVNYDVHSDKQALDRYSCVSSQHGNFTAYIAYINQSGISNIEVGVKKEFPDWILTLQFTQKID